VELETNILSMLPLVLWGIYMQYCPNISVISNWVPNLTGGPNGRLFGRDSPQITGNTPIDWRDLRRY